MLIGLFISSDEKKSNDIVGMLKSKFQGIEFIVLKDLNDDLTMATLAKGSFDKVIVYVNAFSGLKKDAILSELEALKAYKELRAKNVNIQIVDRVNKSNNRGVLEGAYRKLFGSFVDCQYYLKESFNGPILVELIRDIDIGSDYIDPQGGPSKINSSMVSALANESKTEPKYTQTKAPELSKTSNRPNQVADRNAPTKEQAPQVQKEQAVKPQEPQKKKKKGFSLFGRKKFNVVEPDLDKLDTVENKETDEKVVEKTLEEQKVEEPKIDKQEVEAEPVKNKVEEPKSDFTSAIRGVPDEEVSDFLYGDLEEKEIESRKVYPSKFKSVDSAVSRQPEVVEEKRVNMEFKDLNNPFESTNLFNIPTELSSEEALLNKQMQLKELELKTRMLEAQAKIKETELETTQRETLLSPARVKEERVTGYINNNRGRAKIILVTGLQSSGKTTSVKLVGEILREVGYVIDLDLDFENRTLSETFERLDENELTRLGAFRSLRDTNDIQKYIVPIDGNLDVIGTYINLSEAEQNSLEKRLDLALIQPMLRKLSNSGVYGNVVVDCPLEVLNGARELLDISDYVIWTCRGSRHGIKSMVFELSKPIYDEFFFNKLTVVLNGEQNQNVVWKKFFNTSSMWNDDISDSLGAIIPYIEDYDGYFWNDITGLELSDFRTNILEILDLI